MDKLKDEVAKRSKAIFAARDNEIDMLEKQKSAKIEKIIDRAGKKVKKVIHDVYKKTKKAKK